jgi:hypothetical protein
MSDSLPKFLEIGREDRVFGKAVRKTTEHAERRGELGYRKGTTI